MKSFYNNLTNKQTKVCTKKLMSLIYLHKYNSYIIPYLFYILIYHTYLVYKIQTANKCKKIIRIKKI